MQAATAWLMDSEPPDERQIELKRTATEGSLGLGLLESPNHLVIRSISCGMVQSWNRAHPGERVRKGSVILDVNGSSGDSRAQLAKLQADAFINLKLRHVPSMKLQIAAGARVGIEVKPDSLEVQRVVEGGAIDMYNRSCVPGYHVAPGDVIVGVNGQSGTWRTLQLIDEGAVKTLAVARDQGVRCPRAVYGAYL